jgi:hypothetical protein
LYVEITLKRIISMRYSVGTKRRLFDRCQVESQALIQTQRPECQPTMRGM